MKRTLDHRFLEGIANDPTVRPSLGAEGYIDLSKSVGSACNFALEFEHGGFVTVVHQPETYEVHTLFLREGRGKAAMAAAQEAFRYMFLSTDCRELVTRVPAGNRAARLFTESNGFKARFSRAGAWMFGERTADVTYYGVTIEQWALSSTECLEAGRAFHAQLEAEKIAAGSELTVHDDDDTHDHIAGAAYLMIAAGNVVKGVNFYNRWALLAGYAQILLVSEIPAVIDIHDAVIENRGGRMEVLLCR